MTNGGLQDRRNEAEVKESRIKIKNAIRIIDERIHLLTKIKREWQIRGHSLTFTKITSENAELGTDIIDIEISAYKKIKDELRYFS